MRPGCRITALLTPRNLDQRTDGLVLYFADPFLETYPLSVRPHYNEAHPVDAGRYERVVPIAGAFIGPKEKGGTIFQVPPFAKLGGPVLG